MAPTASASKLAVVMGQVFLSSWKTICSAVSVPIDTSNDTNVDCGRREYTTAARWM